MEVPEGLQTEGDRLSHLFHWCIQWYECNGTNALHVYVLGINESMAAMLRSMLYPFNFPLLRT